eukprot:gene5188-biopygen1933
MTKGQSGGEIEIFALVVTLSWPMAREAPAKPTSSLIILRNFHTRDRHGSRLVRMTMQYRKLGFDYRSGIRGTAVMDPCGPEHAPGKASGMHSRDPSTPSEPSTKGGAEPSTPSEGCGGAQLVVALFLKHVPYPLFGDVPEDVAEPRDVAGDVPPLPRGHWVEPESFLGSAILEVNQSTLQ